MGHLFMANRTKWTDHARETFLAILRETCNVSEAARTVRLSRSQAYVLRNDDPDFALEWDDAEQEAADKLEREAWRRAVEGTNKPVFYQGVECGYIREYSDTLMTLLLKAHRPEKYKDRQITEHLTAEPLVIKTVSDGD